MVCAVDQLGSHLTDTGAPPTHLELHEVVSMLSDEVFVHSLWLILSDWIHLL